jgi:hypothetical protein
VLPRALSTLLHEIFRFHQIVDVVQENEIEIAALYPVLLPQFENTRKNFKYKSRFSRNRYNIPPFSPP